MRRYDILDTPPEVKYDDFTILESTICQVPIVLITLLDTGRQWFKSKFGTDVPETARNISFCGHAILDTVISEVPNAAKDPRFHDGSNGMDAPFV